MLQSAHGALVPGRELDQFTSEAHAFVEPGASWKSLGAVVAVRDSHNREEVAVNDCVEPQPWRRWCRQWNSQPLEGVAPQVGIRLGGDAVPLGGPASGPRDPSRPVSPELDVVHGDRLAVPALSSAAQALAAEKRRSACWRCLWSRATVPPGGTHVDAG